MADTKQKAGKQLLRKSAHPASPVRNLSKGAIEAAAKFRGLKTAQLGTKLTKARVEAIRRAVDRFYGIK